MKGRRGEGREESEGEERGGEGREGSEGEERGGRACTMAKCSVS